MKFASTLILLCLMTLASGKIDNKNFFNNNAIITGAEQTEKYIDYISEKHVAVLMNQTSIIGKKHLVDSLLERGVNIVKAFAPEHGFRGDISNGARVLDETYPITGIKIISLYGNKTRPSKDDLSGIDLFMFDIQDVGCRFYTYINVLRNIMHSCAENDIELMILDRPNPNGYLVDGPVLDMHLKSGIGQFPIPISHGMTIAEFAQMINGEFWIPDSLQCKLKIVPLKNYTHEMDYELPVPPSPNLNTQQSIMLYPSTCLFEGTILNHGRGTIFPFTVAGSPALKGKYSFFYTPKSIKGMSETPIHMNKVCYGIDLRNYNTDLLKKSKRINIKWFIDLYEAYPTKADFFNMDLNDQIGNIDLLSGTKNFKKQIISRMSIKDIQNSWEPELTAYKLMRTKYLIYQ